VRLCLLCAMRPAIQILRCVTHWRGTQDDRAWLSRHNLRLVQNQDRLLRPSEALLKEVGVLGACQWPHRHCAVERIERIVGFYSGQSSTCSLRARLLPLFWPSSAVRPWVRGGFRQFPEEARIESEVAHLGFNPQRRAPCARNMLRIY
jgi:hypothetical protein